MPKNSIQLLRKEALVRNPDYEGYLNRGIIRHMIKSSNTLEDMRDSSTLEIINSLNYRKLRLKEISLSEYAETTIDSTIDIIYSYYVELLYVRGYSYFQIENILKRVNKILTIQPELSIMGLDF